eukprot:5606494-Prorocentrum_lima.AAC.1
MARLRWINIEGGMGLMEPWATGKGRIRPQRARSKSFTWEQSQKEWQRGPPGYYPSEVIKDNHAI